MPWKQRGNHTYFYQSVRVGNRVHSEYTGSGEIAGLLAECFADLRRERRQEREADRRDAEYFAERERELGLDDYHRRVESLAHAALALAGYHRHDRGAWRKRRMPASTPALTDAAGHCERSEAAPEGFSPSSAFLKFLETPSEEMGRHLDAAHQGDPATLGWLQTVMAEDPSGSLVKMYAGDVPGRIARILACRAITDPDDHLSRTALLAEHERLGKELAGDHSSALERVLADRVALTWLSLHSHELQLERDRHGLGPMTLEQMERRQVRLSRQFNEAARSLAVPAIRMFLADRQVNVLGGTCTSVANAANGARRGVGHP